MRMNNDLISRKALLDRLAYNTMETWGKNIPKYVWPFAVRIKDNVVRVINELPSVDADPVKHGKWMQDKAAEIQYRYNCSECGNPIYDKIRPYKYCPHCGARMDGE